MGNSHSALSHRKTGQPSLSTSTYNSNSAPPSTDVRRASMDIVGANQQSDTHDVAREETTTTTTATATDLGQSVHTGKRKSLLNFSPLRKRPRAAASSEASDNQTTDSYPSRRLWGSSLRGSRARPTSVLVPSSTTIPIRRTSSAILSAPPPAPTSAKEKGKARDEDLSSNSNTQMPASPHVPSRLDEPPPILDSELFVAEEEMPLSEQVLMELHNLQHQQQLAEEVRSNKNGDDDNFPELGGNTSSKEKEEPNNVVVIEAARAATPIPSDPLIAQQASSTFTPLSDTVGSWRDGTGQSSETNTALPNPIDTEAATVVSSTSEPEACPSSTIPILSPPTSLPDEASTRGPSNNTPTARRPLPPTGTGTIVVVQGVVHTADVRQPQPASVPLFPRPPRTVSSTPALRNLFPNLSSSSTRSATTQPSSRRNRFSSFTDTLRQRSRSRTPTSSSEAAAMRNGIPIREDIDGDLGTGVNIGVGNANQSVLSLDSDGPSDSETSMSLTETASSVGAVVSTDDTSTLGSTPDPSIDLISRSRDDRATNPSFNESANGRNNDNPSDDDADVELSPGSIEVLGTLLSVATAATAASLVNGTTDPLFNPGLTVGGRLEDDNNPLAGTSRATRPTNNNGTDRMRSAWDNLRDRFSRTRRRTPEDDFSMDGEGTREQMVREMARAFNLDLHGRGGGAGAGGAGGSVERETASAASGSSSSTSSDPHSASSPDAPEGSFEQFLHNLQVDLRTALAENYANRRSGGAEAGRAERGELNATSQDLDQPSAAASAEQHRQHQSQSQSQTVSENTNNSLQPPSSSSTSTSAYRPRSPHSANIDLPPLPAAAEPPNSNERERRLQARAITGQPGAGINWWRLYRFPPMVMASPPASAASNANDAASTSNPTAQPPQPLSHSHSGTADIARPEEQPANPQTQAERSEQRQQPQPQQQQPPDGPQQVVPVIVVGLQSVPINRTGPSGNNHLPEGELPADNPAEPTRGRSWPVRAASRAFSRMGRRNDDGSTDQHHQHNENLEPTRERHAGRTYLIFVIGGYYPPNHGIVTGADDMNSFEALWELAELIGQVKPQVASKEDIEQSGLEVLKASKLSEYEASHKVSSNTIERCLICLDDYDPDDDVRLLSCTHTFHRNCVDRWLEQGKNNCPACRSKGVRTADDPAPPLSQL